MGLVVAVVVVGALAGFLAFIAIGAWALGSPLGAVFFLLGAAGIVLIAFPARLRDRLHVPLTRGTVAALVGGAVLFVLAGLMVIPPRQ